MLSFLAAAACFLYECEYICIFNMLWLTRKQKGSLKTIWICVEDLIEA